MANSSLLWKRTRKVLTGLFFLAVIVLLVVYARQVNWGDVWDVGIN